ncbi:MAG: DUF1579 family protein [Vicinamibacteria bacterium]
MSKRILIAAFAAAMAVVVASAQEPQMPKPGPEHKAMGVFAGKWNFEGKVNEGPMGPGGPVTFTENCESYGDFAVVCRSEGKGPMGPTKATSIMSYDSEKKAYTYYAAESGMPPFSATGKHDGKAWKWESESKMGGQTMKTLVTVTVTSPTSYTFEMKASTDGGATWTPVMEGKSTKAT